MLSINSPAVAEAHFWSEIRKGLDTRAFGVGGPAGRVELGPGTHTCTGRRGIKNIAASLPPKPVRATLVWNYWGRLHVSGLFKSATSKHLMKGARRLASRCDKLPQSRLFSLWPAISSALI